MIEAVVVNINFEVPPCGCSWAIEFVSHRQGGYLTSLATEDASRTFYSVLFSCSLGVLCSRVVV